MRTCTTFFFVVGHPVLEFHELALQAKQFAKVQLAVEPLDLGVAYSVIQQIRETLVVNLFLQMQKQMLRMCFDLLNALRMLQTDTTTVVPPGWRYHADRFGNVRMTHDDV